MPVSRRVLAKTSPESTSDAKSPQVENGAHTPTNTKEEPANVEEEEEEPWAASQCQQSDLTKRIISRVPVTFVKSVEVYSAKIVDSGAPMHSCDDQRLREPQEPYDPDHIFGGQDQGRAMRWGN